MYVCICMYVCMYVCMYECMNACMYDDEIWFIRHRYKVMTLLVSARKINNTNKIQ